MDAGCTSNTNTDDPVSIDDECEVEIFMVQGGDAGQDADNQRRVAYVDMYDEVTHGDLRS